MQRTIYFISHPEVDISATVPVTQWSLSEIGRARMKQSLQFPWMQYLTAIYCSEEQKAIDGAQILSDHFDIKYEAVEALGENDRSATGYLKSAEFERTADEFFSSPESSVRGWETAKAAQERIVSAISNIDHSDNTGGDIAIVSHGAVGTLLYCALNKIPIHRRWDQPGQGGGNYMKLTLSPKVQCSWWEPID